MGGDVLCKTHIYRFCVKAIGKRERERERFEVCKKAKVTKANRELQHPPLVTTATSMAIPAISSGQFFSTSLHSSSAFETSCNPESNIITLPKNPDNNPLSLNSLDNFLLPVCFYPQHPNLLF